MIQSPTEVPEKSPLAARHWPTSGVGRVWVAPGTALYDDGAVGLVGTEGTIMPHRAAKMSALLLGVSLRAASAADQNLWDECTHARDSDASIAACTTFGREYFAATTVGALSETRAQNSGGKSKRKARPFP